MRARAILSAAVRRIARKHTAYSKQRLSRLRINRSDLNEIRYVGTISSTVVTQAETRLSDTVGRKLNGDARTDFSLSLGFFFSEIYEATFPAIDLISYATRRRMRFRVAVVVVRSVPLPRVSLRLMFFSLKKREREKKNHSTRVREGEIGNVFFVSASSTENEGHGAIIYRGRRRIDDEVMLSTNGSFAFAARSFFFFRFRSTEEDGGRGQGGGEKGKEEDARIRAHAHMGVPPSKIIPWSVSWHPMIVRQRLEWSVSLSECTCALHVLAVGRLSRSPAAYKTVTSYQEEAWWTEEGGEKGGGGGGGKRASERDRGGCTLTLASAYSFSRFSPLISLLPSHYLFACPVYNLCSSNGVLWR